MKGKFFVLFSIFFLPLIAFADFIVPLSVTTIPLIPFIILIEALVFWIFANKFCKVAVSFWKLVLVTFIANLVTSALGTFIPMYHYLETNLMWIGIACAFSIFIEWLIYIPFFIKTDLTKKQLFKISIIANLITYILIACLIIPSGLEYKKFQQRTPPIIPTLQ